MIDDILQPDNDKPTIKKSKNISDTKSRLDSLKQQIAADPIQINTDNLYADPDDFPEGTNTKYIDYDEEKKNFKDVAEQEINNIVKNYVKNEKLLDSHRLKDLKNRDIRKYASLLLLESISQANLIRLQESIDSGDMSKEAFDSVNKAQKEVRDNMTAIDSHLTRCEDYWENYADEYGLENEEDKIVSETTDTSTETQRIILDPSKLNEMIHSQLDKIKQAEIQKNKDDEE